MSSGPRARDRHVPVLRQRCVDLLAPSLIAAPGRVVVDATLGMGGHSEALLEQCPDAILIGIDRDPQALALAGERLARFGDRVRLVHAVYDELPVVLADAGIDRVHGILMDLGVSSLQLDEANRGFAYSVDAPLDMRMDAGPDSGESLTAAEVINTYSVAELTRVLREYGEERFARRIAERIVAARAQAPFATSARLVELVREAVPAATRRTGGNPAKRTFQALRIEVNAELEVLRRAVPEAIATLAVSGRIVVLAYHSLEDRIVKRSLTAAATSSAPPGMPVERPDQAPELRFLVRGAEKASDDEVATNPRAASVRLRAAERIRAVSTPRNTDPGRAA